jgi:hypothetical protein
MNKKFYDKLKKNCIKKKEILYSKKITQEELISVGDYFVTQDLYNDALDFYENAEFKQGLMNLKKIAILNGDAFLLFRLSKLLKKDELSDEDWLNLAENAISQEKYSYAKLAYQTINAEDKLKELEKRFQCMN